MFSRIRLEVISVPGIDSRWSATRVLRCASREVIYDPPHVLPSGLHTEDGGICALDMQHIAAWPVILHLS